MDDVSRAGQPEAQQPLLHQQHHHHHRSSVNTTRDAAANPAPLFTALQVSTAAPSSPTSRRKPLSPSSRLLRNIEETSDLLRTFRHLKQRGASRDELAALHRRVRTMKESQLREVANEGSYAPTTTTATSAPARASHSLRHADPLDGNVVSTAPAGHGPTNDSARLKGATAQQGAAVPPSSWRHHRHHAGLSSEVRTSRGSGSSGHVMETFPSSAATSWAAPLHSIVFAVVLAESHTRRELAHKWERRLLRLWATFREARVAIALRPATTAADAAGAVSAPACPSVTDHTRHGGVSATMNYDAGTYIVPRPTTTADVMATAPRVASTAASSLPAAPVVMVSSSSAPFSAVVPPVPAVVVPPAPVPSSTAASADRVAASEAETAAREAALAEAARQRAAQEERKKEEQRERERRRVQELEGEKTEQVRAAAVAADRRAMQDGEVKARHALEAAENECREDISTAQQLSHGAAAASETARWEAERNRVAAAAAAAVEAEAARVRAAQAAVDEAAREAVVSSERIARGRSERDETDAWTAVLRRAVDASTVAQAAAVQRQARERAAAEEKRRSDAHVVEAAAAAANERRQRQQRARWVSQLDELSTGLVSEWVAKAAAQASAICAEMERRLSHQREAEAAATAAAQEKAAQEREEARSRTDQEEAADRNTVNAAESAARQQVAQTAEASRKAAGSATASRLEKEEAATRAKAMQEALSARRAVEEIEVDARGTVEHAESASRQALKEDADVARAVATAAGASRLQAAERAATAAAVSKANSPQEAAEAVQAVVKAEAGARVTAAATEDGARRQLAEVYVGFHTAALAATRARLDVAAAMTTATAREAQAKQRQLNVLSDASQWLLDAWVHEAVVAHMARVVAAQETADGSAAASHEVPAHVEGILQQGEEDRSGAAHVEEEEELMDSHGTTPKIADEEEDETSRESGPEADVATSSTPHHDDMQPDEERSAAKMEHCAALSNVADSALSQWLAEAAEEVCGRAAAERQQQEHQRQQEENREAEAAARSSVREDEAATRAAVQTQELKDAAAVRKVAATAAAPQQQTQAEVVETVSDSPSALNASSPAGELVSRGKFVAHALLDEEGDDGEEEQSAADAHSAAAPTTPAPSSSSSSLGASAHALGAASAPFTQHQQQRQLHPPSAVALVRVVDNLLDGLLHDAAREAAQGDLTVEEEAPVTPQASSPGGASLLSIASTPLTLAPLSATGAAEGSNPLEKSGSLSVPALVNSISPPPQLSPSSPAVEAASTGTTPPPPPLPREPQLRLPQPEIPQHNTTSNTGASFSSPLRSSSMTSSVGDDDEESPATAAAAAQGVPQPQHLTPPPNRKLSPLLAAADMTPDVRGPAGEPDRVYGEESSLCPEPSRAESVSEPLPATEDALTASSHQCSAADVGMGALVLGENVGALDLDAPHTVPPLLLEAQRGVPSVAALEATSAHLVEALIHDAVCLPPFTCLASGVSEVKEVEGNGGGGLFGSPERRHSPSHTPELLERVHPLSPSHPHTPPEAAASNHHHHPLPLYPPAKSPRSGNTTTSSISSSSSSGRGGAGSVDGERHTEKRQTIGELGRGFTRADAQEALPVSPTSSPSLTPLVGAPAIAPGGTTSGSGLTGLTTLVTAVATPTDFVTQLRQQEASKRAAAHQQNQYLTAREVAVTAAGYLTSESAAQQVEALGPVEALGAQAVALVLGVGLVHCVTVANRRARRRVEAAAAAGGERLKSASAPFSAGSKGAVRSSTVPGAEITKPTRAMSTQGHTEADIPAVATPRHDGEHSSDDEDNMAAPASSSFGHHGLSGFGGVGGGFPTSGSAAGATSTQEEEEEAADPYTSANGTTAPSVMSPSTAFPAPTQMEATASPSRQLLSPPPPVTSPTALLPGSALGSVAATATVGGAAAAAHDRLPMDWAAGLRGVAERVARDLMDYATRRVLLAQGESQGVQDRLRTPAESLQDALATVHLPTLFTQELRVCDVTRLTSYYLELALSGSRERADPHYAPSAQGEHNIFGRRSSGDVMEEGGSAFGSVVGTPAFLRSPAIVVSGAGGGAVTAASRGSPLSVFSPTVSSPPLHARSNTFLTAATAMHVRRARLMQVVFEQCIENVLHDVVGDTVGWLGTTVLQPADAATTTTTKSANAPHSPSASVAL